MNETRTRRALELYRYSVLKQAKLRELVEMLGATAGKRCLDIGSDNGVISLLLRSRGGSWASADLDERTVESIRELVGDDVHRLDGLATPFPDASFDLVVIVDFLEHIHTDREFVRDLHRILRPGGRLVVNVPHLKPHSLINRLRHAIGQTDARHGHVRPGYSRGSLRATLEPWFEIDRARTYSGSFSELLDTVMRFGVDATAGAGPSVPAGSSKGAIITGEELAGRRKSLRFVRWTYPLLAGFARLDHLLFLQQGYKLIVSATARRDPVQGVPSR